MYENDGSHEIKMCIWYAVVVLCQISNYKTEMALSAFRNLVQFEHAH